MSLASVRDLPNTINCRKLIGRASFATHLHTKRRRAVSHAISESTGVDEAKKLEDILVEGLHRSPFRGGVCISGPGPPRPFRSMRGL